MKKVLISLGAVVSAVFLMGAADSVPTMPFDCSNVLRDSFVCKTMRHMRSNVHFLGEQREHMQVNFPALKTVGDDIQDLIANLLVRREGAVHLEDLAAVQDMAHNLSNAAAEERVEALMYANNIQNECLKCHNSASSRSGYEWDDIYRVNWNMISKQCNTPSPSRNPYICKSMFAMLSVVDYFNTSIQLQRFNYESIKAVAGELHRVASDLKARNMIHGEDSQGLFQEVMNRSYKIIRLAELENPEVQQLMAATASTCFTCHGVDSGDRRLPDGEELRVSPFQ